MKIVEISKEQYRVYIKSKTNVPFQHQLAFYHLLVDRDWKCKLIGLVNEFETLVGVAILSGKKLKMAGMMYTCQYGPYLDYHNEEDVDQFFTEIVPFLKKLNCSLFTCNPPVVLNKRDSQGLIIDEFSYPALENLIKYGYKLADRSVDRNGQIDMNFMYIKLLNVENEEQLIKSYKQKLRQNIKTATSYGLEVSEINEDEYDQFCQVINMSAEKHHYKALDRDYFELLKKHFKEDVRLLAVKLDRQQFIKEYRSQITENKRLLETYTDNRKNRRTILEQRNLSLSKLVEAVDSCQPMDNGKLILTAGVFIRSNDQIVYFVSGNDSRLAKMYSSSLIQHHVMCQALHYSIPVYNMYGISSEFTSKDSVREFKARFNGHIEELYGTLKLEINPGRMKRAAVLKKLTGK